MTIVALDRSNRACVANLSAHVVDLIFITIAFESLAGRVSNHPPHWCCSSRALSVIPTLRERRPSLNVALPHCLIVPRTQGSGSCWSLLPLFAIASTANVRRRSLPGSHAAPVVAKPPIAVTRPGRRGRAMAAGSVRASGPVAVVPQAMRWWGRAQARRSGSHRVWPSAHGARAGAACSAPKSRRQNRHRWIRISVKARSKVGEGMRREVPGSGLGRSWTIRRQAPDG